MSQIPVPSATASTGAAAAAATAAANAAAPTTAAPSSGVGAHAELVVTFSGAGGEEAAHVWAVDSAAKLFTFHHTTAPPGGVATINVRNAAGTSTCIEHMITAHVGGPKLTCLTWGHEKPVLQCSTNEFIQCLAASPDGQFLAAGTGSGKVYMWEVVSGMTIRTWTAHYKSVTCLTFSRCSSYLITGSQDALIHLWDLAALVDAAQASVLPRPVATLSNHTLPITGLTVSFGADVARLYSVSTDCTCKVWDLLTHSLLASFSAPSVLTAVAVDQLEQNLVLGSADGRIFVVNLHASAARLAHDIGGGGAQGSQLESLQGHTGKINSVAVTARGNQLVSTSDDGSARVWDIASRQHLRTFDKHTGPVTCAVILPKPANLFHHEKAAAATISLVPFRKTNLADHDTVLMPLTGRLDSFTSVSTPSADHVPAAATSDAIAELHAQLSALADENQRWKKVNNTLLEKLRGGSSSDGAASAGAPVAQKRSGDAVTETTAPVASKRRM